ncbi:MAG: hypothetical protein WD360_05770 [Nitriliruptoraceae bacterium]
MERFDVSASEAFAKLAAISRADHILVRDLSAQIVATGQIP